MLFRIDANIDYRLTASKGIYSILSSLRTAFEVQEIWLTRQGGSNSKTYQNSVETYNIYNFHDGREIIEGLRPDLIILNSDYEYLTRSLLRAGTALKIPVVMLIAAFPFWVDQDAGIDMISGRLHALRTKGGSLGRRYFFLLRTLVSCGYGFPFILKTILKDIIVPFTSYEPTYKFGGADLNIVSTPEWINTLVKNGIDKKSIVVAGDWGMDLIYDRISHLEKKALSPDKLEILFVTTAMVEHGYWKPGMRNKLVTEVINTVKKEFGDKCCLKLKIHPASENFEEYRKLVDSVDPSIEVIQKSELLPLINDSSVIVTFGESWALFEALLLSKPIFIMNLFDEDTAKNPFLDERLAIECKTVEEFVDRLKNTDGLKCYSGDLASFLEKSIYKFDGKSGERAANYIMSLIQKHTG